MELTITRNETVNVTPELLAEIFWEMHADDQAEFFNHLGQIVSARDWAVQVNSMLASDRLDKLGRRRMEAFTLAGVSDDGNE